MLPGAVQHIEYAEKEGEKGRDKGRAHNTIYNSEGEAGDWSKQTKRVAKNSQKIRAR